MARSAQQIADFEARLDQLADLLIAEVPMPDIEVRMGTSRGGVQRMFGEMRRRLGWQAS